MKGRGGCKRGDYDFHFNKTSWSHGISRVALFMNCALAAVVVVVVAVVVNTARAVEDCTGGLWAR